MVNISWWTEFSEVDLVLLGRVYTFNRARERAEAIAVRGNRIVYVGDREGVTRFIGSRTRVIDAGDRGITPGLIDSHAHLAMWGLYRTRYIDLSYPAVDSIEKLVEVVREASRRREKGSWILGRGWNHALYPENRLPNRWDLDRASEEHPIVLWHTSGHMVVANSLALRIAGIDENTRDPEGGVIIRDENGSPTGILAEKPAIDLIAIRIPRPSIEDWVESIYRAMSEWISEGITAVKDPTASGYSGDIIEAYRILRRGGRMIIRVVALYWTQSLGELLRGSRLIEGSRDPWLRIPGIKIILDGALSTRTAWISRDYKGSPGVRGLPTLDLKEFREIVLEASSRGYMVSVHAIGDMAIEELIRAYEEAVKRFGRGSNIYTVIHYMLPDEGHIDRLRMIGGYAEIQSGFIYFLADAYYKNLEPDLYNRILPIRSMISKGLVVCNGSDAPVIQYPPRYGIYAAATRESSTGLIVNPGEAISIEEAFATYTSEASKCLGMEDLIGSIEPGKLADIVIWDRDPIMVGGARDILNMRPLYTIVDGKIVFPSPSYS